MEATGKSNRSISASMGHLVRRLNRSPHPPVRKQWKKRCLNPYVKASGRGTGLQNVSWRSSKLLPRTPCTGSGNWGRPGSHQDLRELVRESLQSNCGLGRIDAQAVAQCVLRHTRNMGYQKLHWCSWDCWNKPKGLPTGCGSMPELPREKEPEAGTAGRDSPAWATTAVPGRPKHQRRWRPRFPMRREHTSHRSRKSKPGSVITHGVL